MLGIKRLVVVFAASLAAAAPAPAPASADPLPDCAAPRQSSGALKAYNCRIRSDDRSGLVFEPQYDEKQSYLASVRVLRADGSQLQTIAEDTAGGAGGAPSGTLWLFDLDGDGRDEVLIAAKGGGAHDNPTFAVWRSPAHGAPFARAGELFGHFVWRGPNGLVGNSAWGAPGDSFSFFDQGALHQVAETARVGTHDETDQSTGWRCQLAFVDLVALRGWLRQADLTPLQAQTLLCGAGGRPAGGL